MKERPILFSGPMVRAILDGKKTQTRRVIKPQPEWGAYEITQPWACSAFQVGGREHRCPHGESGDGLWVRETWASVWFTEDYETEIADDWGNVRPTPKTKKEAKQRRGWPLMYRANETGDTTHETAEERGFKWLPSIFMPRWASRIDLKVTGVRVERLQDISGDDAMAEGLNHDACGWFVDGNAKTGAPSAKDCFIQLWDSINAKKHPWESNPWVWVVEFKAIKRKS